MINYILYFKNIIENYWSFATKFGAYSSFIISSIYSLNILISNGYNSSFVVSIPNPYLSGNIINIRSSKIKLIYYSTLLSSSLSPILLPIIINIILTRLYNYLNFMYINTPKKIATNLYQTRKYINSGFKEDNPENCPICLNSYNSTNNKSENIILSCGHYIHKSCFKDTQKTCCPICRQEIYLSIDELEQIVKNNYENYN